MQQIHVEQTIARLAYDSSRVVFTHHALDQFSKRYAKTNRRSLQKPEVTARQLLYNAKPDTHMSEVGRVVRIIDNDFQKAYYLLNNGWRLVIVHEQAQDKYIVVTVERDLFLGRDKSYRGKRVHRKKR